MSVASLISSSGGDQSSAKNEETNEPATLKSLINSTHNTKEDTEEKEEISPLDAAIQAKNDGKIGGFVTEAANPDDEAALRNPLDTDERREDLLKKMNEIDTLSIKAKSETISFSRAAF